MRTSSLVARSGRALGVLDFEGVGVGRGVVVDSPIGGSAIRFTPARVPSCAAFTDPANRRTAPAAQATVTIAFLLANRSQVGVLRTSPNTAVPRTVTPTRIMNCGRRAIAKSSVTKTTSTSQYRRFSLARVRRSSLAALPALVNIENQRELRLVGLVGELAGLPSGSGASGFTRRVRGISPGNQPACRSCTPSAGDMTMAQQSDADLARLPFGGWRNCLRTASMSA